ncbi:hypothetical protein [Methyloceanibacter stevinii]|uniref:hypothetical protein n=1 Tax=Methyloceanibacter stevinii TaxID=1774970 RepID=UPI0019D38866|nr:hypothetical protein [Methyloceanibacter stevinii]
MRMALVVPRGALAVAVAMGLLAVWSSPAVAGCVSGPGGVGTALSDPDCEAFASGVGSLAVGKGAIAPGFNSTTIGTFAGGLAAAFGGNTAIGTSAGTLSEGDHNTLIGASSGQLAKGDRNTWSGTLSGSEVTGNDNAAFGFAAGQSVTGNDNVAMGHAAGSNITASNTVAIGTRSLASANGATAIGMDSQATGANAIAIGSNAVATGSVAVGNAATASNGGAAFGDFASATGSNSTAIGPHASAAYANSAAFGAGATATRARQQVFGTSSNSYTMPGLTSSHSKSAQGSPTHVVTSNGSGDLAAYTFSELGLATGAEVDALNTRINKVGARTDEAIAGVALAMSIENPDLTGNERFGVAANWGAFENANAIGMSLMGVLGTDFVAKGDRVAISGGFGIGLDNGRGDDVYGGRVGLQWTH